MTGIRFFYNAINKVFIAPNITVSDQISFSYLNNTHICDILQIVTAVALLFCAYLRFAGALVILLTAVCLATIPPTTEYRLNL